MTITVQLIIKRLIVQKCWRICCRSDTVYITYKKWKKWGAAIFSPKLCKEAIEWVSSSNQLQILHIQNDIWFDTDIIHIGQVFAILLQNAIFLYSQWQPSCKMPVMDNLHVTSRHKENRK